MRLTNPYDAVAAALKPLGDEGLETSCCCFVVSDTTVDGDDEGDWGFNDIPVRSALGTQQGRIILSNIQDLVSPAVWPAPDNRLYVFLLAECSLREGLTLMELCPVLTNEQAVVESRIAEVHR